MTSLFAVPDWDEQKDSVQFDFQKKKIKLSKKAKAEKEVPASTPTEPATQNDGKKKKNKKNKGLKEAAPPVPAKSLAVPMKAKKKAKGGGSLTDKLKEGLKASRFRFLNECLYKSKSSEAVKMFKEDPEAFNVYHEGYRNQVEHWPTNPLNRIIKQVAKIPKDQVIADFGCGDAKLSTSVPHKVYSLDLVSTKPDVIACDMAKTPLKKESINVVVFCLSLMGTNLRDFLVEANRVLKDGGTLKVAEVKSRFENVDEFLANVQGCGFKLLDKDLSGDFFYYFNFRKVGDAMKMGSQFSLKPCLYKKR